MKKLFLSSSFAEVSELFPDFTHEDVKGKKVTFIPTASIPESVKFYVGAGKKALEKLGLIVDELEITKATSEEISKKIQENDYIYITGGNTFFLLQELKRNGTDKLITDQINSGKIYIGESAGSIILAPDITYVKSIDDCRKAPELTDNVALSIVKFYPVPHHTNVPFKKAVEKIIAQYGSEQKLVPISNSQVIMANGNRITIREK
jgi:dipeptidase E